jgi:tetratricopeptide (TPR) repeat protein
VDALEAVARDHPSHWLPAATLAGLRLLANGDTSDAAVGLLRRVFEGKDAPETDAFIVKYFGDMPVAAIGIAPGVMAELPFSRDLVGLALAEVLQARGEVDAAIDVVERVTPTAHAAVSLAELYSEAGRDDEVIELTNGVTNQDDTTALLLVYRGIAFTRQQLFEAARESFKEALKSKKRANEIRYLALRHRAEAYAGEGKKAQARKDLERILAEDATVEGVRERLDDLTAS